MHSHASHYIYIVLCVGNVLQKAIVFWFVASSSCLYLQGSDAQ